MRMSYPGKNHVAFLYKLQNTDRYRVSNKFNTTWSDDQRWRNVEERRALKIERDKNLRVSNKFIKYWLSKPRYY